MRISDWSSDVCSSDLRQAGRIVSTAARQPSPFAVVNYVVLVALVVAALIFVKAILISALIGIGIGVILAPALQHLQHVYKIPRAVSAVVMVVALATVFGGIGYVIFLIGETQLASLVQRTPELIARLQSRDRKSTRLNSSH